MKIEVLYPEVANLYGELANITYLKKTCPEAEVIETALNETPAFLDEANKVDFVYMGTMTESAQLIVLEALSRVKEELVSAIERGQFLLATGNALELFGKAIDDTDGTHIDCLGIFDFNTKRDMNKRFNSLYIGDYRELKIVGFKSQFTHAYYNGEPNPLFMTAKGPGFNPDVKPEGIRYKNFMATYLIGPLFVLNPMFMTKLLSEMGYEGIRPAHEKAAMEAYEARLAEYSEPNRGFYY